MTACTSESVPTCLAEWAILVVDNSMPPRDPNDDDDEEEDDENDDAESDEDEPAVIREPDE